MRTGTLIALEALGGSASTGLMAKAVEGEFPSSVKNAIAFFVGIGALKKRKTMVSFANKAWVPALRALLKAYAREYPAAAAYAKAARLRLRRWNARPPSPGKVKAAPWPLLQSDATLPLLAALLDGPQSKIRALAHARTTSVLRLNRLLEMGVLCEQGQSDGGRLVSFNRAYPVYRELRALVAALSRRTCKRVCPLDLIELRAHDDFTFHGLFGMATLRATGERLDLRTNVMVAVAVCKHGEIDSASLGRMFGEHDAGTISRQLRQLAKAGIVERRRFKIMWLYRLNERFEVYPDLYALLQKVAKKWPEFLGAAAIETRQYSGRRKKMERWRKKRQSRAA